MSAYCRNVWTVTFEVPSFTWDVELPTQELRPVCRSSGHGPTKAGSRHFHLARHVSLFVTESISVISSVKVQLCPVFKSKSTSIGPAIQP